MSEFYIAIGCYFTIWAVLTVAELLISGNFTIVRRHHIIEAHGHCMTCHATGGCIDCPAREYL